MFPNFQPGVPSGTSFPTTAAAGDIFFRTDLGFLCYYDGTRWLTSHELSIGFVNADYAVNGSTPSYFTLDFGYFPAFTRISVIQRVQTTNDLNNYWIVSLYTMDHADQFVTQEQIASWDSSLDPANLYVNKLITPSAPYPTKHELIRYSATKNNAPGNLNHIYVTVSYRLIIP